MTENEEIFSPGFAALWIGQLVFPSVVCFLTTSRILYLRRDGMLHGSIINAMLKDGIMYFL